MRLVKCDAPDEHEPLTLETDSRKKDSIISYTVLEATLVETSTKRDGYLSGADEKVI